MENMGFERSQIDAAMRAAFYNSERAIEYLLGVSKPIIYYSSTRLTKH
jgi:UV excision repair protein RAD23